MIPALSLHLLLLSQFQLSSQKTLKLSSLLSSNRGPPLRHTVKDYVYIRIFPCFLLLRRLWKRSDVQRICGVVDRSQCVGARYVDRVTATNGVCREGIPGTLLISNKAII